jgi:hypothetical protein
VDHDQGNVGFPPLPAAADLSSPIASPPAMLGESSGENMRQFTEGRYRTEASEHRPARAYVIDGGRAYFVTEKAYRD